MRVEVSFYNQTFSKFKFAAYETRVDRVRYRSIFKKLKRATRSSAFFSYHEVQSL